MHSIISPPFGGAPIQCERYGLLLDYRAKIAKNDKKRITNNILIMFRGY